MFPYSRFKIALNISCSEYVSVIGISFISSLTSVLIILLRYAFAALVDENNLACWKGWKKQELCCFGSMPADTLSPKNQPSSLMNTYTVFCILDLAREDRVRKSRVGAAKHAYNSFCEATNRIVKNGPKRAERPPNNPTCKIAKAATH